MDLNFARKLPVFRGYTVDYRRSQFRKFEEGKMGEFIEFDSEKGDKLLRAWIKTNPAEAILEIKHYAQLRGNYWLRDLLYINFADEWFQAKSNKE